jgi:hypothetical protein
LNAQNPDGSWADHDPYENPAGAYDFIHQFFDPRIYYSGRDLCSHRMVAANVGLPEVCVGQAYDSYYKDPRVAGWILSPSDWGFANQVPYALSSAQKNFFDTYWGYFYSLVHWQGAQTGFAAVYAISPDGGYGNLGDVIHAYKAMFANQPHPDVFGLAWYGNGSYPLGNVSVDLNQMIAALGDATPYSVPPDHIAFMEGGSDQAGADPSGVRPQFYRDAIRAAAATHGIFVWEADGYANAPCSYNSGAGFRLFDGVSLAAEGTCPIYPSPGWHYNGQIQHNTSFGTQYGVVSWGALSTIGQATAAEFALH